MANDAKNKAIHALKLKAGGKPVKLGNMKQHESLAAHQKELVSYQNKKLKEIKKNYQ